MGNIAYITTKKHVKFYDILDLLNKINQKRFDGKLTITQGYEGSGLNKQDTSIDAWKIGHLELTDYLWLHCDSPKKLACKHPHNPWMSYVFVVFLEELGALTKGICSDEGVTERWKPRPKKYPSYKAWIEVLYSYTRKSRPAAFEEIMKFELACAPEGMENY